jgi:hypothetical protein
MRRNPLPFHIVVDGEHYESLEQYQPAHAEFHDRVQARLPPRWQRSRRGPWFSWRPPCVDAPLQGWKIHVSSTLEHSVPILDAAVSVCARHGVAFKHALDVRMLAMMNGKSSSREQGGKFVTIYPRHTREFLRLLDELSAATEGFDGPLVLTDRRYPGSRIVQYRYGGIAPVTRIDVSGRRVSYLVSPDGELVRDERRPEFHPPQWVADPCPPLEGDNGEAALKDGRYEVQLPLTFTNAGGVYVGVDRISGRDVVIKETRPHVLAGGREATQALRNEWEVLTALRGAGIAPEPIDLFQDWEHWFLVEEKIDGIVLTRHSAAHSIAHRYMPTAEELDVFWQMYRSIFANLARAIDTLHAHAFVFGDLSSSNVMVQTETLKTTLIDPETVHRVGAERPQSTVTLGFVPRVGDGIEAPSQARDRYALGAMMLRYLLPMEPLISIYPDLLDRFMAALRDDFALPPDIGGVVRALLDPDPAARPALSSVARVLAQEADADAPAIVRTCVQAPSADAIVDGGIRYILKAASFERRDRLFPANGAVYETNPLSVAYGACGVAHALRQVIGECPPSVVDWIGTHTIDARSYGPGLYSGLAGIAWTLHDLGLREQAAGVLREAVNHPRLFDAADLFNGAAGVGLTALALHVRTGEAEYLEYARWCGEEILARAQRREAGLCWEAPDQHVYYGFGYGASGTAVFLLYLFLATRDERWLQEGRRALAFDLAGCIHWGDQISWPYRVGSPGPRLPYLEFGAAGVGAAVLRYQLVSPCDEYARVLAGIANDVVQKYAVFPGHLMGLAGLGQFFVDAAVLAGDAEAFSRAQHVANGIRLVALAKDGGYAFGAEHFFRLACDFGTGSAGIVLFLDNLARGRTSSFMVDELLPRRTASPRGVPLSSDAHEARHTLTSLGS